MIAKKEQLKGKFCLKIIFYRSVVSQHTTYDQHTNWTEASNKAIYSKNFLHILVKKKAKSSSLLSPLTVSRGSRKYFNFVDKRQKTSMRYNERKSLIKF